MYNSAERLLRLFSPLIVLGVGSVLFAGTLHNPFTSDDVWVTIENPQAHDLSNIAKYFVEECTWIVPDGEPFSRNQPSRWGFHRPLLLTSYALDAHLSGMDPFGWRLTNLVLHLVATLLILGLARELLGSRLGALAAALLFVAHPIHTEAVATLLGGRAEILACISVSASWWMFLAAEKHKGRRRQLREIFSACLFLMGLLSKENAVVLPGILFLCGWTLRNQSAKTLAIRLIPHAIVMVLFTAFRLLVIGWVEPISRSLVFGDLGGIRVVLSILVILATYLRLVILPYPLQSQTCYADIPAATTWLAGALSGVVVLGLIGIAVWQSFRGRKQGQPSFWSFSLLVFYLGLLPVSHLIPFPNVMAERFLYLPSAALCLLVGFLVVEVVHQRWWIPVALGIPALTLASWGTLSRNAEWADLDRFWSKTAQCSPQSPEPYNNLGNAHLREGNPTKALPMFEKAAALAPQNPRSRYNIGVALQRMGRFQEAERAYREALSLGPEHSMALLNLGTLLQARSDFVGAKEYYQRASNSAPRDPEPYVNLGNLLQQEGRCQEAENHFRLALRVAPRLVEARFNLARLLDSTGRTDEAERLYKEILDDRADHPLAHNNLANILKDRGQLVQAQSHYEHALRDDPDCAPAHYNLANLFMTKNAPAPAAEHYTRALALQPDMLEAQVGLGYARLYLGQLLLAKQAAEKASRMAPGDPRVEKLLGILRQLK